MKKILCIIFCLFIFVGCETKTGNEFEKEDFTVISIDESIPETGILDSFIDSIKYIPLETNKESMIHSITRFEVIDEKIVIFDKPGKSVLVFNSEGRFLHKIGKIGTGYDEFLDIRSIATDESKNRIYLFDQMQSAVLEFDIAGNFIDKTYFNNIFFSYFKKSNDKIYCFMHNRPYKRNFYDLICFEQNEVEKMYFPFSKKDDNFWFLPQYPFYIFNNQLNFVDIFSGRTFVISDNPVPGYLIDFGQKQMPLKYRKHKDLFFENKNDFAYLTLEFLENEKYLQFSYHWGKDIFNCLFIKNENKAIKIRNPYNWQERVPALFVKPSFAKDNYFISVFNNLQCVNLRKISKRLKDQQLANVVKNIDIGSNPVLIMYFLK